MYQIANSTPQTLLTLVFASIVTFQTLDWKAVLSMFGRTPLCILMITVTPFCSAVLTDVCVEICSMRSF